MKYRKITLENAKVNIPDSVRFALEVLNKAGHEAYVVGGAVRDLARGTAVNDWDVTTSAAPNETKHLFSFYPVYETGIKHGTVSVNINGNIIEITTFRTDGEYTDSRHPNSVSFTKSLCEDLARRDFTVNAMAMDKDGTVTDLFSGMQDLERGVIRAVGDPKVRFTEDALRIMRAYRFCAKLGFALESETEKGAIACKERLDLISRERINEEWKKMLTSDAPSKTLLMMYDDGILAQIFQEVRIDRSMLTRIDKLEQIYVLRCAAVLSSCETESISTAFSGICPTNTESNAIKRILSVYKTTLGESIPSARRLYYDHGENAIFGVKIACIESDRHEKLLRELTDAASDPEALRSRKNLAINGTEILREFKLDPRRIGDITETLIDGVLEGRIKNEKSALLEEIARLI